MDLLPGGSPEVYKNINEIILADDNVDAVVSIFVEPVMVDAFSVIESVNSIKSDKPVYQVCMPLPVFWNKYNESSKSHIPIFRNPEDPAELISNILFYEKNKNRSIKISEHNKRNEILPESKFLDQTKVDDICRKYELPIVENKIIKIDELYKIDANEYPLVVKGLSKDVIHKSEFDAVKLNIKNHEELFIAISEIKSSFNKNGYELGEVLIQPFIKTKHELLIGGFRDLSFGPVVMFGTGGKYVEVLDDTKIKSAYIDNTDLDGVIVNTKIGKILKGVRGEKSVDIQKLKIIIQSVSKLMIENNNISEIDLNPLVVDSNNNFHAVDVRIKS